MGKHATITAQVDPETLALVDKAAESRGLSRAKFAAEAIRRAAESDADFLAFVQEGIDAADRGDVISQEEMEAWFEARITGHRAAAE